MTDDSQLDVNKHGTGIRDSSFGLVTFWVLIDFPGWWAKHCGRLKQKAAKKNSFSSSQKQGFVKCVGSALS